MKNPDFARISLVYVATAVLVGAALFVADLAAEVRDRIAAGKQAGTAATATRPSSPRSLPGRYVAGSDAPASPLRRPQTSPLSTERAQAQAVGARTSRLRSAKGDTT